MTLIISKHLAAARRLVDTGLPVATDACTAKNERLRIAFVNLMPTREATEFDFMQLIAHWNRADVEVIPVKMLTHTVRSDEARAYLDTCYRAWSDVADTVDGVIITGAPLEDVGFEGVDYWDEIVSLMCDVRQMRLPVMGVCWGAFALVKYWYGIGWQHYDMKISGVFPHDIYRSDSPLMTGLNDGFLLPHSRHVGWDRAELDKHPDIEVVAGGEKQGVYYASSRSFPEHYLIGHGEYAVDTLDREYRRDLSRGINPHVPENYYPDDNPNLPPELNWAAPAQRIMANWLDRVMAVSPRRCDKSDSNSSTDTSRL